MGTGLTFRGVSREIAVIVIHYCLLQFADVLLVSVAAPTELLHYFSRQFDDDGGTCKAAESSPVLVAGASV